ncbi:acetylglutamate kinase [Candidatus Methylomirabilis limnetica]|uniref:Acetylglutamate kinase n=1 Tax=Candidatus Methylomirabilis limnetica TaxID=2033718 RepID=A0A2T4TYD0_9BACT|nr:acetylglutamate kinase [Candidatus Methylomirabilis limnetica]PTL36117.1 acetylglutamate kinase [Candidatus Methylomirabilis limnetica]
MVDQRKRSEVQRGIDKAKILIEALPYIKAFAGKAVVIKYGGAAMTDEELKQSVALDIILMRYVGMQPVVVHGGGPEITRAMERSGLTPTFVGGFRVTDQETMKIVEMVLVGQINQELVALINSSGGSAVGLSGKDGGLIRAKKAGSVAAAETPVGLVEPGVDLGFVGEIVAVDARILRTLERDRFTPVVAPTGVDEAGVTYNINADLAAGEIASALQAEKLVLLTDTDGILDKDGALIPTLSRKEVERLIADGVISGGMLPKVQACLTALDNGVRKTHIVNGTIPHALLLEIFTSEGVGTEIIS